MLQRRAARILCRHFQSIRRTCPLHTCATLEDWHTFTKRPCYAVLFTGEQDIAGRYRRLFTVLSDNETFKAIDFATVSVSESPEIARRLGVKVVPTVAYGSNSVDVEKSKGTQLLEGGRSAELRKVMTILLNAVDSSSASPAVQKELEAPDTEGTTFANSDKPSALKALADKIDLSMPLHSEDDLELSQTSLNPQQVLSLYVLPLPQALSQQNRRRFLLRLPVLTSLWMKCWLFSEKASDAVKDK